MTSPDLKLLGLRDLAKEEAQAARYPLTLLIRRLRMPDEREDRAGRNLRCELDSNHPLHRYIK